MADLEQIKARLTAIENALGFSDRAIITNPKEPEFKLRQNLKTFLMRKNIKAAELARAAGVSKQSICDWQAGLKPRDPVKLKRVALTLGVTIDELCF